MSKKRWKQTSLRMPKNHEWKSKPGYKIFVANAGEVRFDFPEKWVFIAGESALEFHEITTSFPLCAMFKIGRSGSTVR